jgi:hypothetical protein
MHVEGFFRRMFDTDKGHILYHAIKPAPVVTSIKQSAVLKGHHFLVLL